MTLQTYDSREGNPALRFQAAALLARYPELDPNEVQELLDFYNSAPAIDTALLTCDEALRPQIASFLHDQAKQLRHTSRTGLLVFVSIASIGSMIYSIWAGLV